MLFAVPSGGRFRPLEVIVENKELFQVALGIVAPWFVDRITFDAAAGGNTPQAINSRGQRP